MVCLCRVGVHLAVMGCWIWAGSWHVYCCIMFGVSGGARAFYMAFADLYKIFGEKW